ncbi:hypothetical protein V8G54_009586 [Vigna mungo]|uniref:Uncharacterized protein n=1 Tax=Vigna mungo TaxID=3915 RepID=A0AAQ3NV48_VIGMU
MKLPASGCSSFWPSVASFFFVFFFFFFFFFSLAFTLSSNSASTSSLLAPSPPSCCCFFTSLCCIDFFFFVFLLPSSGSGIFKPYSASSISSSERKPAQRKNTNKIKRAENRKPTTNTVLTRTPMQTN